MAFDPTISLGVRPVETPDPLETVGKIAALKSAQQQQEMGGLQLQMAKLDLQDQQRARQAYMESGGDMGKYQQLLMKNGVSPKMVMDINKQLLTTKKTLSEIDKNELEVRKSHVEALGSAAQALLQLPPDARAAAYPQVRANMIQQGRIKPEEAPEQYPGDEAMQLHANSARTSQQIIDSILKERQVKAAETRAGAAATQAETGRQRFDAELKGIEAATVKKQLELAGQALPENQEQYVALKDTLPPSVTFRLPMTWGPDAKQKLENMALTPMERKTLEGQAAARTETARHNLSEESAHRLMVAVSQGHLAEQRMVNGMKYGPGTAEYWVQQLQDNPDSIKEMPPELRSNVGKGFTKATGLPLPTAASEQSKQTETAARNALDGAKFIQDALQNPEIRKNIGPILGRLGEAEQAIGTAARLSPEAEKLAQELRTRMRYFVFQEGKALLSGRLPQQLMKELEKSSANPRMDANMLQGALNGAVGNAQSVMDNVDRQRFGGKMRPRAQRGQAEQAPTTPAAATSHVIEINGKQYRYNGSGATDDLKNYTEVK